MVKCRNRIISILLVFLLSFNILSSNFIVYATDGDESATERTANFLNFYQNSEETLLDMANLTTNDYYAMFNFMSNWFKPGSTTLADVYNADTSFFTDFSSALGKSGNEQLKSLVQAFGRDVVEGINQGKCTIVDSTGKRINGYAFMTSFLNTVSGNSDEDFDGYLYNFTTQKLYFEDSSHLAFDLSVDAVRASFQTIFAYNPDLFLMSTGIASLNVFYLDAIGNLWGGTSECVTSGYDWTNEYNKGNALDVNKLDKVYLILPACLNPSSFTPNVTDSANQSELRMPLMNRFVLSALVTKEDLTSNGTQEFAEKFIPIYDVLSYSNDDTKNNILNVIGIHSISPYTLNTIDIASDLWSAEKRRQNYADFVYNPKSFVVDDESLKNNGIAHFSTNSYVVFAMSIASISGANGNAGDNSVIDLAEGLSSVLPGGSLGDLAFDLFDAENTDGEISVESILNIKKVLTYFLSPTILTLNEVSMNFYKYEGYNEDEELSTQFQEFLTVDNNSKLRDNNGNSIDIAESGMTGINDDGLTSSEVSKLGLSGMSLFLNDINISMNTSDGVSYHLSAADNMVSSKLVNELRLKVEHENYVTSTYLSLKDGNLLDDEFDILNLIFRKTSDKVLTERIIFKSLAYHNNNNTSLDVDSQYYLSLNSLKNYLSILKTVDIEPFYKEEVEENTAVTRYPSDELKETAKDISGLYDGNYKDDFYIVHNEEMPYILGYPRGTSSGGSGVSSVGVVFDTNFKNYVGDTNSEFPIIPYFIQGYLDDEKTETDYGISNVSLLLDFNDNSVMFLGSNGHYSVQGRLLGARDKYLHKTWHSRKGSGDIANILGTINVNYDDANDPIFENNTDIDSIIVLTDYITALYGYSLFFPSDVLFNPSYGTTLMGSSRASETLGSFGVSSMINSSSGIRMRSFNQDLLMGMYLGYMVDMMGIGTCSVDEGVRFGSFSSPFLPKYTISAKGGSLELPSYLGGGSNSGVNRTDKNSFEDMQKNLIYRIWEILTTDSSEYRNSWIESFLDGIFLTFHRTITGTWGANISTVSTGNSNTYQSVTGYTYTPVLEELPFAGVMLNNYLEIYVICMLLIIFLIVLMVLLHIRTWQQGILTCLVMSLVLLFPYILISNSINFSNRISDTIYSDRFAFWALNEHQQTNQSLQSTLFLDEKDRWFIEANATEDSKITGNSGVKIKWMAPKKVDIFQNMHSDSQYSQSFATNMQIFKWLFSSFIYDSEFVGANVNASYLYREYRTITLEANSYYEWTKNIRNDLGIDTSYTYNGLHDYIVPDSFKKTLETLGDERAELFSAGIGRLDNSFYLDGTNGSLLVFSDEKLSDIMKVSQSTEGAYASTDMQSDRIGMWGMLSDSVNDAIVRTEIDKMNLVNPGIISNLPLSSQSEDYFDSKDVSSASLAVFLKNTESPYYYFYSVLKHRYAEGREGQFKEALLNNDIFRITDTVEQPLGLNSLRSVNGSVRDFLDMEGLFEYVIPYLKLTNDYVEEWQRVNGSKVESFNFEYDVDETTGEVKNIGVSDENIILPSAIGGDGSSLDREYQNAVIEKNARNRIWNMYSPWVDSLYDLDIHSKRVIVGANKITIQDTLNPSSYIKEGRPMIFSEADMIIKGYNYSDLTDVEKRIQAVLENTRKDLLYLVNYYSYDDEVLLSAAAMYATFHFNSEFSENNFLKPSVMLYPQSFELRNFNYDAYMRLALYNATGESIFATEDLYERILDKTSFITGICLILCDFIACVLIPFFKFVIIVALLFLGILVCIACAISPPEKLMDSVLMHIILPTALFTVLNIGFSWLMSLIVGEGLTAYVGSKTINFATNDPTITLIIMGVLGVGYVYCAVKILKLIVESYKKFGLSTVVTGVGVVSSAITAGAKKVTKKSLRIMGKGASGVVGAGIGAATAGKGNRLSGAYEGLNYGTKAMIARRIAEKRQLERDMKVSDRNAEKITKGINAKASKSKDTVEKEKQTIPTQTAKPTGDTVSEKTEVVENPKDGTVTTTTTKTVTTETTTTTETRPNVQKSDNLPEGREEKENSVTEEEIVQSSPVSPEAEENAKKRIEEEKKKGEKEGRRAERKWRQVLGQVGKSHTQKKLDEQREDYRKKLRHKNNSKKGSKKKKRRMAGQSRKRNRKK